MDMMKLWDLKLYPSGSWKSERLVWWRTPSPFYSKYCTQLLNGLFTPFQVTGNLNANRDHGKEKRW